MILDGIENVSWFKNIFKDGGFNGVYVNGLKVHFEG